MNGRQWGDLYGWPGQANIYDTVVCNGLYPSDSVVVEYYGPPANVYSDSSRHYYSLSQTLDSIPGVYRGHLDSVHSIVDSIEQDVSYVYDERNWQILKTSKRMWNGNTSMIDSVVFAYADDQDMDDDNAVIQVAERLIEFDSAGSRTTLSRSTSDYELSGSWKAIRGHVRRSLIDPTTEIVTHDILSGSQSFDDFGNLVSSIDASGDTSGVKYSPDGSRMIATIANGFVNNAFLFDAEFDFEQDSIGYDGWINMAGQDGYLTDDQAFTGKRSYELVNDGIAAGLKRVISVESLVRDIYILSFWARSLEDITISVVEFDGGVPTQCSQDFLWEDTLQVWKKHELVLYLGNCVDSLSDSLGVFILVHDNKSSGTKSHFDDIRLHPIDASISTSVYDEATGLLMATSGSSNVPAKYEYDKLSRLTATLNFKGDTLNIIEYGYVRDSSIAPLEFIITNTPVEQGQDPQFVKAGQFQNKTADSIHYTHTWVKGSPSSSTSMFVIYREKYGDAHAAYSGTSVSGSIDSAFGGFQGGGRMIGIYGEAACAACTAWISLEVDSLYTDFTVRNWVKTTTYLDDDRRNIAVTFSDGLGRVLQTRVLDSAGGDDVSIVSGLAEYDARGRATRVYKPYLDLLGSTGVDDFSEWDSAMIEILDYYDTDRCADCDTLVYSEYAYSDDFKSELDSSSAPGLYYHMSSGKVSHVDSYTEPANDVVVQKSLDPDNIEARSTSDRWGRTSVQSTITDDVSGTDHISTKSYFDLLGRADSISHLTDVSEIKLSASTYNDIGEETNTWKVDYGNIQMLYDNAGNIRLMMNDKREAEDTIVYFKYDNLGRKIEEGLVADVDNFVQDSALSKTFPDSTEARVTYQWFYDYFARGVDTLVAPGKLVRVASYDRGFFRNYFYFPEEGYDSVVVKLRQSAGAKQKAIIHHYNRDGSLKSLTVYPDKNQSDSCRIFEYHYDAAGRLSSIERADVDPLLADLDYCEFAYNGEGGFDQMKLGVYDTVTVQQIDYSYDALGRLISINDTSDVVDDETGDGASNDHFGQEIVYNEGSTDGYFNGRISKMISSNSYSGAGTKDWGHEYNVNDLNWLYFAEDIAADTSLNRYYYHDELGRRDSTRFAGDLTEYEYETYAGSSRLRRVSDMLSADSMYYDTLGNLVADTARSQFILKYDYRNLMTLVQMVSPADRNNSHDYLYFDYDHMGRRIKKKFHYHYWFDCPPDTLEPPPKDFGMMMMGGPVQPPQCLLSEGVETHYLYDGDVLLATFDDDDNVIDMFVNSPAGRIAIYKENDSDQLYYFLNDYLGTPRVVMQGPEVDTIRVAAWYLHYPYGEIAESEGFYDTPYRFTGKEHDEEGAFDYFYFGARYYDYHYGRFSSLDKVTRFANGFVYADNNPAMFVDPDGNCPWLIPVIIGAVVGGYSGYQYAEANGLDPLSYMIGGAIVGGLSGYAGAYIGEFTSIGGMAASSGANSMGWNAMTSGEADFTLNFGIGSWNLSRSHWRWADLQGNLLEDVGTVTGWLAFHEDYSKVMSKVDRFVWGAPKPMEVGGLLTMRSWKDLMVRHLAFQRCRLLLSNR